MALNLVFAIPLHHYYQLGHVGLALATACSAWLNAALLFRGLARSGAYQARSGWGLYTVRLLSATVAMAGLLWLLLGRVEAWVALNAAQRALEMALLCGAGGLTYAGVLGLLGVRLRHFRGQTTKL